MGAAAHGGDIGPDGAVEGAGSGVSVTDGVGVGAGVGVALGVRVGVEDPEGVDDDVGVAVGAVSAHPAAAPTAPSAPSTAARRETSCLSTSPPLLTAPAGGPPAGGSYPARVSMPSSQVTRDDATPTGPAGPVQGLLARWFDRILWVNAMLQVLIIVSGGLVRLTGSGLGCPTWPQCVPGSYVPVPHQEQGIHKFIEFGNRTLTGVLGVAALLAVIAVWQVAPRRHLKRDSLLVLGGIVLQALLGGLTVLAGLHPVTVATHFLVSAGLVAIATRLHLTRHEPDVAARSLVPSLVRQLGTVTCLVAAIVLTLGTVVTGSGPHSGDADTPARFGLDPRTISWLHADAVMLFVGLVVATWVAVRLTGSDDSRAAGAWGAVLLVTVAQGVVGYAQYLTDLPWLLVLGHMLLAALLVVTLTRAMVALRTRHA